MSEDKIAEKETTAPDDVAEYNALVRECELSDIRLVNLKFDTKPAYFSAIRAETEGNGQLVRAFDGQMSDIFYDEETQTLGGQFDWSTEVRSGKKKLLKVEARYLVVYGNVPDVAAAETRERYIQRVGKFATYPYYRSLVSQISWGSKTDLPIMPVLK